MAWRQAVQPLKFENGLVISSHYWAIWLLIHAGIKVIHVYEMDPWFGINNNGIHWNYVVIGERMTWSGRDHCWCAHLISVLFWILVARRSFLRWRILIGLSQILVAAAVAMATDCRHRAQDRSQPATWNSLSTKCINYCDMLSFVITCLIFSKILKILWVQIWHMDSLLRTWINFNSNLGK